jgi:hypothetical protein
MEALNTFLTITLRRIRLIRPIKYIYIYIYITEFIVRKTLYKQSGKEVKKSATRHEVCSTRVH